MRVVSWVLLASAVVIGVVGLIVDGTRAGEDPNLAPLYMVAVVLALLAFGLGSLGQKRGDTERN